MTAVLAPVSPVAPSLDDWRTLPRTRAGEAPGGFTPMIRVLADGVQLPDGCMDVPADSPTVLSGLSVNWGRDSTIDQPSPASCSFEVWDPAGGQGFLSLLRFGAKLDVIADAQLWAPTATVDTLPPILQSHTALQNAQRVTAGAALRFWPVDPARQMSVAFSPAAHSSDPTAWDTIPRTAQGQNWTAAVTITPPLTSVAGWTRPPPRVRPLLYTGPQDTYPEAMADLSPTGGTFTPPAGYWVGLQLLWYPTGPLWSDVGQTWIWAGAASSTRTNATTNPRAVSTGADGWVSTRGFGTGGAGTYSYATGLTGPTGTGITTARRKTWTTAPSTNAGSGFQLEATAANHFAVTAGQQITASCWMKHSASTAKRLQMSAAFFNAISGGTQVGSTLTGQVVVPADGDNTWQRVTITATVPAGAVGVRLYADVGSGGTVGNTPWTVGATLDATGLMIETAATAGTYFDGATVDTPTMDYAWTGTANASASTATVIVTNPSPDPSITWAKLDQEDVASISLKAPSAGTVRSAMVFSGRVTDLEARYENQATIVHVIAQDQTADLANRGIGDQPWPVERLDTRARRILDLAGYASTPLVVTPLEAGAQISYRDVDHQPAMALLGNLGQSADGYVWVATHVTTGPVVRLDSIQDRPSLQQLVKNGVIHIITRPDFGSKGGITVSACSVELDPVRWDQSAQDVATRVDVVWKDQQVDDTGNPAPQDTTLSQIDSQLELSIGAHRVQVNTSRTSATDAGRIAGQLLSRLSRFTWQIHGLTWNQTDGALSSTMLDAFMQLLDGYYRFGLPMMLTDLPTWSPVAGGASQVPLFLEGGRYTHEDGAWTLELRTSSAAASGGAGMVLWNQIPADWLWNQWDPTVRWLDLAGVGI